MGQKVNPHGIRVGVIKDWDSKWYAEADFADNLVEDYNIRKYLKKKLYSAGIAKIEIERASDKVKVIIHTAKPGVVIGKGGAEVDALRAEVQKLTNKKLSLDIKEIKRPDRDAQLVAENIALQLENRVSFRRAMKSVMSRTMKSGVKGIKTMCAGLVQNSTQKAQFLFRHYAQISIMDLLRQIQHTERSALRFGFTRVMCFQQRQLRKGAKHNVIT